MRSGSFLRTTYFWRRRLHDKSYWLERDLLDKARRLTAVPVRQMIVPVHRHS